MQLETLGLPSEKNQPNQRQTSRASTRRGSSGASSRRSLSLLNTESVNFIPHAIILAMLANKRSASSVIYDKAKEGWQRS